MDPDDLAQVLLASPVFMRDAACVEHPDVDWFPERGGTTAAAKAICERCLCRDDCLAYALDAGIEHGVWGALSGRERKALASTRT